jgi:hypothetical protein
MPQLGTLRTVNIRDVWQLEPQHFSTWLADNLTLLGDAIGMNLELRRTEETVGTFSADLVAIDPVRDRIVVIENQLGRTDHDHLGKLITYAAGLQASAIIWVSPEFREEHREALDWLNRSTDVSKEFFGIEIQALQIDDSLPAPNFKVIAFPNGWQKNTNASVTREIDDARAQFMLRYFTQLSAEARASGFRNAQSGTSYAYLVLERFPTGAHIAVGFSRDRLIVGFYISSGESSENTRIYRSLADDAAHFESLVGLPLTWDFREGRSRQQIWTSESVDRTSEHDLARSRIWAIDAARRLKDAFEARFLALVRGARGPGETRASLQR